MVEADNHLRLLYKSIFDTYKVFVALVCYLTAIWIWLQPYTVHLYPVTMAKLAQGVMHAWVAH